MEQLLDIIVMCFIPFVFQICKQMYILVMYLFENVEGE